MTDSNGVLSDYSFSSSDSNVSVSKSGNKLTISSTVAISGSVRITAKRNNVPTVSSSAKLIAYGDPNLQDLVTGVENADTVSAYINIETPTGTIALKKTSEDGVVEGISFTIKGDNFNKTVKTERTALSPWRDYSLALIRSQNSPLTVMSRRKPRLSHLSEEKPLL